MVVALVGSDQVRDLRRLQEAAGITATTDEVTPGHDTVRQIATSGTPVPPPVPREQDPRGTAKPARRPQNSHRGQAAPRSTGTVRPQQAGRSHDASRRRKANRAA
jgi:hypothetical protein